MEEFIIEYEMEKVKSSKTKNYLTEVISSYNNKNYRSSIVTLYSIVIFDLIHKLKILSDVYDDDRASEILDEINTMQEQSPHSPKWEEELIEQVLERTELLNRAEYKNIKHLKDNRNLSAHPIYNHNYELINPNREQVRAHIRNMFEATFTKEALLCKKIINDLVEDISDFYDKVANTEGLQKYLKSKYFSKINKNVKNDLFKTLWKFVFKLDNDDCNKNRFVNYKTLLYLVKEDPFHYVGLVKDNKPYYSDIELSDLDCEFNDSGINGGSSPISALIYFLSRNEEFYKELADSAKIVVEKEVDKHIRFTTVAYFLSENFEEHINKIKELHDNHYINDNFTHRSKYNFFDYRDLYIIYEQAKEKNVEKVVMDFFIEYFGNSTTYDISQEIYDYLISEYIDDFDKEQIEKMFKLMNENHQIYNGVWFENPKKEIKEKTSDVLGEDFNYSDYENIWN